MSNFSRTWWGQEFIQALEHISDDGRLSCRVRRHQPSPTKIDHLTATHLTVESYIVHESKRFDYF